MKKLSSKEIIEWMLLLLGGAVILSAAGSKGLPPAKPPLPLTSAPANGDGDDTTKEVKKTILGKLVEMIVEGFWARYFAPVIATVTTSLSLWYYQWTLDQVLMAFLIVTGVGVGLLLTANLIKDK